MQAETRNRHRENTGFSFLALEFYRDDAHLSSAIFAQ
jgi:hypothetical protein